MAGPTPSHPDLRPIPTLVHGVLDYVVGLALIAAPFVLGFYAGGAESWVPILLGIGVIVYSLVTDYELGLLRRLPMPTHLVLDMAGGALLLLSPWLFGFSHIVVWPHVVVGALEIAVALLTKRTPTDGRTPPSAARTQREANPRRPS